MTLTRGERFKDARIIHNQHGKQTMDEVEAATGINKSLIQALEDDDNDRDVGYTKVATLAAHYHVAADFLFGLTDDPSTQPSAVDELGISPKAVEWIKIFAKNDTECFDYDDTASIFNSLLEDESFTVFFYQICSFFYAKRAEYIYDSLLTNEYPLDESGSRTIPHESIVEFNRKIKKALEDTAYPSYIPENAKREDYLPHAIADYLEAILELEDSEPGDSNYFDVMEGLFSLRVSEIPELRARKAFDGLLRTLNRHAEIEGELKNIPKCLSEAMR
jgi:transcriptional regulator with XRE-family HTH domain